MICSPRPQRTVTLRSTEPVGVDVVDALWICQVTEVMEFFEPVFPLYSSFYSLISFFLKIYSRFIWVPPNISGVSGVSWFSTRDPLASTDLFTPE